MSFADNLKNERKKRGLSQEELADRLNVSRQAVSKWEQGIGFPELEKLLAISKEFDVSLDYLMDNEVGGKTANEAPNLKTGKITVKAQDGKIITNCYKFMSFPVSKAKNAPRFALFGVDGKTLFDENRVFLGWYANEETIEKEIDNILKAMEQGEVSYELKYAAKVKKSFLSLKLDDED